MSFIQTEPESKCIYDRTRNIQNQKETYTKHDFNS